MKRFLVSTIMILCVANFAAAQGIVTSRQQTLWIEHHRVDIDIGNQAARTKIDQVFVNQGSIQVEGEYIFALPADASVSSFAMYVDGKRMEGELLESKKARQIYMDIVRKQNDPALLEYIGRRAFRAQIFPIPAGGKRRVQLEYSETLEAERGIVRYVYPLNTAKFSLEPVNEVSVTMNLKGNQSIKSIYSPTHDVDVRRKNEKSAVVAYEESIVKSDQDFVCYYTLSEKDFGIDLIAHRKENEDGYFMLLIAPKRDMLKSEIIPKDVTFVLDVSGSMKGKKLAQAKEALSFCVSALNENDRFNILNFSTIVEQMSDELMDATAANQSKALEFIKDLQDIGGTNLNEALLSSIKNKSEPKRLKLVVFLTDGLPTVGETDINTIIGNVREANKNNARLFIFGIGYDVNTKLLDTLAKENHGMAQYVEPNESVEVAVSAFYDKVSYPVLTDVKIDVEGVKIKEMYPKPLPDLYLGEQLIALGRYDENREVTATLTGTVDGEERSCSKVVLFPAQDKEHAFLPQLYAQRKVGYLLEQIRLHGENDELRDEVIHLSRRYGIITPYTSFIVLEDRLPTPQASAGQPLPRFATYADLPRSDSLELHPKEPEMSAPVASGTGNAPTAEDRIQRAPGLAMVRDAGAKVNMLSDYIGGKAVKTSKETQKLKSSSAVISRQKTSADKIKRIGEKVFYLKNGFWVDSEYKKEMKITEVKYGSDAYFELLNDKPELGKYFAIGKQLILCYRGVCYRVN